MKDSSNKMLKSFMMGIVRYGRKESDISSIVELKAAFRHFEQWNKAVFMISDGQSAKGNSRTLSKTVGA